MRNLIEPEKNKKLRFSQKIKSFFLIFCLLLVIVAAPPKPVHAQLATTVVADVVGYADWVWTKVKDGADFLWKKAGAIAFQRTLSTALNKIAYDTANYIGSGGSGQKPLFVTQNIGAYLNQIGDEAMGTFVESFVNNLNRSVDQKSCDKELTDCNASCSAQLSNSQDQNNYTGDYGYNLQNSGQDSTAIQSCFRNCANNNTSCAVTGTTNDVAGAMKETTPSFNVCSPSSLMAKVQIGLGLVQQTRPAPPNCTLSKMITTWDTDINKKLADLRSGDYLNNLAQYFDPQANDLGISVLAKTDLSNKALVNVKNSETGFIANKGWLNVTNIAGDSAAPPGTAERTLQEADAIKAGNIGKITTDVFVDAANVFLNQLAVSAFNKLVQSLGKQDNGNNAVGGGSGYSSDPNSGRGATALKQVTTALLKPNFGTQADYDILSSLAVCQDSKNPGPDNCVIDSPFMQAISEKKTVIEAINDGSLHGDWQVTNSDSGDAYNSEYSLRNISILIKYRILPIGWAEVASIANNPVSPHRATLNDLVSCFNPLDQYTNFSQDFGSDTTWCQGLVDPNWVLKAPLNYCQKEGFGAQLLSTTVTQGIEGNASVSSTPSTLNILRADNYCADGQTCIKEKPDGSCEVYGYCNGEKRTWNFNTDSCEPVNNTCQSFTGVNGQAVAYLQNTLNYNNCNSSNAGCRQYSLSGIYATSTGTVSWSTSNSLYLNKSLGTCSSPDNGCTELMRVKSTWGNNLVMDSDFNNEELGSVSNSGTKLNDWPLINIEEASIVQDPVSGDGKVLKLAVDASAAGGVSSNPENSLLPANFQIVTGQFYTMSADVYLENAGSVSLTVGSGSNYDMTTAVMGSWQHLNVTRSADSSFNDPNFVILGSAGITFYVKNLKFEASDWDTGYTAYGQTTSGSARIYEKLLPNYLEKTCYNNVSSAVKDYTLKSDAPAVCSAFARKCNQDEVGCDSYTNIKDYFVVTAKVASNDYCPAECLGYDVYISKGSYFNSAETENIIPATATKCSAEAAGCSEFTNLDSLAQGGEQKEYYTSLKQCIKPSTTQCASFYAWEGQASGYQLQAYSLKKDAGGTPATTAGYNPALCTADIYNKPVNDPLFNPDCREFYNASGTVAYLLSSQTITCSDNCHTYRMTDKNIDSSGNTVCLNGGTWDATSESCFYSAIPGEGQTCRASENGCREYNGSTGSNVRVISFDNFESGLNGWSSSTCFSISPISNNKDGHSLHNTCVSGEATSSVSGLVNQGSAYTLRFLGLAPTDTTLTVSFRNKDTGTKTDFSPIVIKGGSGWNIYRANLTDLDQSVGNNEELVINGGGEFYLDDFVLSEISDRYYLIKNSSQISDSCYYDLAGNYQGADYNLGCAQYTDRNNLKNNLHKFTKLCSDSAVGCEQMIDTKNYSPYGSGFWEGGVATTTCNVADPNCVMVPGDSALYAVYDAKKQCNAVNLGCSRLGQGQGGNSLIGFSDVFKLNNPNQYETILCNSGDVGCETWTNKDNNSVNYFKDPGNNVCVYRAANNASVGSKKWYKIPAKRCDLNKDKSISGSAEVDGPICLSDSDCGTGAGSCILDKTDHECAYSVFKTIGLGGGGVPIPSTDAGICDVASSGCTEYIDPVTRFNPNLVNNPSFTTTTEGTEGWGDVSLGAWSSTLTPTQQVIALEPYKLYSLNVTNGSGSGVILDFTVSVRQLLSDNNFGAATTSLAAATTTNVPVIFDSLEATSTRLSGGAIGRTIEVRELAVDYQLQSKIDKTSCTKQAQFNNGCVLFNERGVSGASGLTGLDYDAYATNNRATNDPNPLVPSSCSGNSCTANEVIKVSPNRVCSRWLSCTSYTQDPITKKKTCYAYNECNSLDNQGECNNYTTPLTGTTTTAVDGNATGYSLYNNYNLGQMEVVGRKLTVSNGDFEDKPDLTTCATKPCPCTSSNNSDRCLIDNPDVADSYGTDHPAHGKTYLMVPLGKEYTLGVSSDLAITSGDYFINYLVNTKKSNGAEAQVTITNASGAPIKTFSSISGLDWTREIHRFTLTNIAGIQVKVSHDGAPGTSPVYFDDIKIEPVLKISNDKYVASECRLYPTGDSLTCVSKNKNTITSGLEGYCLEHDPANPSVCLLWYPMDNVPTNNFKSNGYHGPTPLSYATEVSGNFDLVEKREAYLYYAKQEGGKCWDPEGDNTNLNGRPQDLASCQGDSNYFNFYYKFNCTNDNNCCYFEWCIPKTNSKVTVEATHSTSLQRTFDFTSVGIKSLNLQDAQLTKDYEYFNEHVSLNFWLTLTLPSQSSNGWYVYDGLNNVEKTLGETVSDGLQPIRIYDYTKNPLPSAETDLTLLKNFKLNYQDKSVQVVDDMGNNKAWVERVKNIDSYPTSTPPFFHFFATPYNLMKYESDINTFPFGSYGSNQGRPYGCSNSKSCGLIGSCTVEPNGPNTYCVASSSATMTSFDSDFFIAQSCGTGLGTCQPLWTRAYPLINTPSLLPYKNILKNIFLQGNNGADYSFTPPHCITSDTGLPNNVRPNCVDSNSCLKAFCSVYPTIFNFHLYSNDNNGNNVTPITGNKATSKGWYRLEFNSIVDPEQQPLKSIDIDWGDGKIQTITNQDNAPATSSPHIFYHNYLKIPDTAVHATTTDNWGFTGSQ
ncbi:MAG: hypothetical protein WC249_02815 [Patescibacteria group bacterium]|jgi:hypothetical protein